jgi:hypothetical protein
MNAEQIFYKVSKHLLEQNKRAMVNGGCQYLARGGQKCAIGCLIKKKHYNYELEGLDTSCPRLKEAVEKSIGAPLFFEAVDLLDALQAIHDDAPVENWESSLRALGEEKGFEYYYEYI